MNTLERMGVAQSVRCKKPLSIKQFSEINAETRRLKGEQDCLRGLEPQETGDIYTRAYARMYERLERLTYLDHLINSSRTTV